MTGRWAEEYPAQARSIGRDPLFEVANHSYSHYAFTDDCYGLPTVSENRMRADVERAYGAFREAGVPDPMPYFRFPGGCYDRRALKALTPAGVTAVQWDVVGGDAFATDADAVARQVLEGVRPGSVVVLHCTRSAAPADRAGRTRDRAGTAEAGVPVREGVRAHRGRGAQPEQAVRCASCHSHTGHRVIPLYDSGYSVGFRHWTHSAYGGPSAFGGVGASRIVQ